MARLRSIKPEFCTSEQIAECSTSARLLFVLMWMHCDDQGVHPAKVLQLKMECFPADPFTAEQMREWIDELLQAELLREYEAEGAKYWQVTGWHHQKIDRPTARYPLPPSPLRAVPKMCRGVGDDSTSDRRGLGEGSPSTPRALAPESSRVESSRVESIEQGAQKRTPDSGRGSRIARDWTLPDDWRVWATDELGLSPDHVQREAEKFHDYWLAAAGAKARKADWLATWRGWMRRSKEDTDAKGSRGGPGGGGGSSARDRAWAKAGLTP